MSQNAPATSGTSPDFRTIQNSFVMVVLLQFVLLAGLVILYVQIGGVPDQTAQQVPQSDPAGAAVYLLGPIGDNITDLQAQVGAMAAKIDAICTAVQKGQSAAASPNACAAP